MNKNELCLNMLGFTPVMEGLCGVHYGKEVHEGKVNTSLYSDISYRQKEDYKYASHTETKWFSIF